MKKLMITLVAVAATTFVKAQEPVGTWSLKPMVGVNLSDYSGEHCNWSKSKWGLVAGMEVGYQTCRLLELSLGVNYSQQGSMISKRYRVTPNSGSEHIDDIKLSTEYVNVPLLANFYVVKGLALKTGLQCGYLTKAKEGIPFEDVDGKRSSDYDQMHNYKRFDLSLPVGLSYEYCGFVVDVRYIIGLTRSNEDSFGLLSIGGSHSRLRNSVFQMTLGYKFAL